jgi:hypothetical protein
MFEKYLLIFITVGAIALAAAFATAQDSQSDDQASGPTNNQTLQTYPHAHERGCGHQHDARDPARCTAELTAHLNSTPDRQAKVLSAIQSGSSRLQSVRQDTSLSPEDARSKTRDIRTASESEIRGVLDYSQENEWEETQSRGGHRASINVPPPKN